MVLYVTKKLVLVSLVATQDICMTTAVKSVPWDFLEINAKTVVADIVLIMKHVIMLVVCAHEVVWTDILEHVVITLVGWGITAETAPWFVL